MALSERQAVLAHLVRVGAKFDNPKDMMTYLAIQTTDPRSPLRDQRDYLQKLIDSGYQSKLVQTFYDDYKSPSKTVTAAAKKSADAEVTVEPDPPQDQMENPETITDEPV